MPTTNLLRVVFLLLLLTTPTFSQQRQRQRQRQRDRTRSRSRPRCTTIQAAVKLPAEEGTFFFNAHEYIDYNHRHGAEGSLRPISRLGLRGGVQAAFKHPDDSVFFLTGCTYQRFNVTGRPFTLLGTGELSSLGLPCDVDAAVNWEGELLAFKGCDVFKYSLSEETFQVEDTTLADKGLPCQLDAAVEWTYESVIFLKGHQLWHWSWGEVTGPHHTDRLNICSWYLCGEADWMRERMRHRREITSCNGDVRLCPLRLDQVTLPGLHNAGSGFAGGFGFLNCWMRNHGLNITEQLRRGIRHLDVDPCYETCGLLGTCHAFSCGGSVCAMIKQIREFMRENRNDVITVNFNHEIVDENKVFRGLSRQLEVQVRPLLNRYYRVSPRGAWPTLQRSIRINRRLFVFYAPIIENEPHSRLYYNRKKWIHSENLLASTWRPFSLSNGCEPMIALTNRMCESRKYKALVEVSVIPESGGACTHAMADACRPHVHQMLRACEAHRFPSHKSPNIVLVDWPEEASDDVTSVYHAVRHQNVRNIATHRPISCQVRVDAAFHMTNTSRSFFFVGQRLVEYDHDVGAQIASRSLDVLNISAHGDVSSAFFHETTRKIHVFQGCRKVELDPVTLTLVSGSEITRDPCTPVDAALTWNGMQILFEGCHVHNPSSPDLSPEQLGFPCDVDAALMHDGHVYAFKGNDYYRYDTRQNQGRLVGRTLDWTIDAVQCP